MSDAPAFIDQLPAEIRGDAAFAGIADLGTLAKNYLAAKQPVEFTSLLPEEIRGDANFRDIKDIGNLARSFINAQKLLGGPRDQLLQLPLATDPPEAWNAVYDRLGRPAAPDKYELADPDKLPDGLELSAEGKTRFATRAHELGLTQKQADALYRQLNDDRIAAYTALVQSETEGLKASETALKGELGQAYDRAAEDGNLVVDHLDKELGLNGGLTEAFNHMPAKSRPALFKAFAAIGAMFREDGKLPGRTDGGGFGDGLSPAQAMQQRAALFADKEFMAQYRSSNREIRQAAIARMQVLNEAIAAGNAAAA